MLVRHNGDGTRDCIHQEHHALLSGLLAGHWHRALEPRLVSAITLHDNPWRLADRSAEFDDDAEDVLDFVTMPTKRRIPFYQAGIEELEAVDPYVAYMTSRHYTAFAGMRGLEKFQAHEAGRRERLRARLHRDVLLDEDLDLQWIQYFDIFSLHLCLTGPDVPESGVPRWLTDPDRWSTAPDGTEVRLRWVSRDVLGIDGWPFQGGEELALEVSRKSIGRPSSSVELRRAWEETSWTTRRLRLVAEG